MSLVSFKKHPLSDADRLWLREAVKPDFDQQAARVQLMDQLPADFDPRGIDPRLYADGRLSLLGLWHADPKTEIFQLVDKCVRAVRDLIKGNPHVTTLTAKEIAAQAGLHEDQVSDALYRVSRYGTFFSSASGPDNRYTSITFNGATGEDAINTYLRYTSLDDLLERHYHETNAMWVVQSRRRSERVAPTKSPLRQWLRWLGYSIRVWWCRQPVPNLVVNEGSLIFGDSARGSMRNKFQDVIKTIVTGVAVALITAALVRWLGLS